jgi:hypothetical protein
VGMCAGGNAEDARAARRLWAVVGYLSHSMSGAGRLLGFHQYGRPRRTDMVAEEIKAAPDPADEGLVGVRSVGALRDQAGTYVNLIASSPIKSLATRRSGGRGPAKNALPRPSTTGRK